MGVRECDRERDPGDACAGAKIGEAACRPDDRELECHERVGEMIVPDPLGIAHCGRSMLIVREHRTKPAERLPLLDGQTEALSKVVDRQEARCLTHAPLTHLPWLRGSAHGR